MAKQTAAQRKAAAKKAAATRAANAANATQGATSQTPPTQGDTSGAPQGDNQVVTQAGDPGEAGTSILDQAIAFSMGETSNEKQALAALDLWESLGCEALPPMLAVAIFDCANDQGAAVCERLLGKIGITRDEGQFDLSAVEDRGIDVVVRDFLAWRLRRYAFTAAASAKMLEWSQHILALQALTIITPEETTQA